MHWSIRLSETRPGGINWTLHWPDPSNTRLLRDSKESICMIALWESHSTFSVQGSTDVADSPLQIAQSRFLNVSLETNDVTGWYDLYWFAPFTISHFLILSWFTKDSGHVEIIKYPLILSFLTLWVFGIWHCKGSLFSWVETGCVRFSYLTKEGLLVSSCL